MLGRTHRALDSSSTVSGSLGTAILRIHFVGRLATPAKTILLTVFLGEWIISQTEAEWIIVLLSLDELSYATRNGD